jgi:hypothetical protein
MPDGPAVLQASQVTDACLVFRVRVMEAGAS